MHLNFSRFKLRGKHVLLAVPFFYVLLFLALEGLYDGWAIPDEYL